LVDELITRTYYAIVDAEMPSYTDDEAATPP